MGICKTEIYYKSAGIMNFQSDDSITEVGRKEGWQKNLHKCRMAAQQNTVPPHYIKTSFSHLPYSGW